MSYVYFIQAEKLSQIKVGIADNPDVRLRELQTGSYAKLFIRDLIKCEIPSAIEAIFHDTLKEYRSRESGEWFNISLKKLRSISDDLGYTRIQPNSNEPKQKKVRSKPDVIPTKPPPFVPDPDRAGLRWPNNLNDEQFAAQTAEPNVDLFLRMLVDVVARDENITFDDEASL